MYNHTAAACTIEWLHDATAAVKAFLGRRIFWGVLAGAALCGHTTAADAASILLCRSVRSDLPICAGACHHFEQGHDVGVFGLLQDGQLTDRRHRQPLFAAREPNLVQLGL